MLLPWRSLLQVLSTVQYLAWAARYNTWLLIVLDAKRHSLFFSFLQYLEEYARLIREAAQASDAWRDWDPHRCVYIIPCSHWHSKRGVSSRVSACVG